MPSPPHVWLGAAYPCPPSHRAGLSPSDTAGICTLHPHAPRALASSRGVLGVKGARAAATCSGPSAGCCHPLCTPAEHQRSSHAALSLQHISAQLSFDRHIGKETLVEAELNVPQEPTCPQKLLWLWKRFKYLPALRRALGNSFSGLDEKRRFWGEAKLHQEENAGGVIHNEQELKKARGVSPCVTPLRRSGATSQRVPITGSSLTL